MKQLIRHGADARTPEVGGELWETLLQGIDAGIGSTAHFDARTLDEALYLLREFEGKRARVIGGGLDILRMMKQKYAPELPGALINIKNIPGLEYIKEENGVLKIGALTCLSDVETSELIKTNYSMLAEAAAVAGSPQVRNMATVAGSICQDLCCWYYRASRNYYQCLRKGGANCPAVAGDNRWMFSIFGAPEECGCFATCQSDISIALSALSASIKTTQRTIPVERFYTPTSPGTALKSDEVITEIQIPALPVDSRAKYSKFSIRKSWDHPLVSVACVIGGSAAKIALGGVFITPYGAAEAEDIIRGKEVNENLAERAGEAAVENAAPMSGNAWKVELTKTLVKRVILALI